MALPAFPERQGQFAPSRAAANYRNPFWQAISAQTIESLLEFGNRFYRYQMIKGSLNGV